jgi:hypothetical protein
MSPIRVFVFSDHPEALLIVTQEGDEGTVALPPLAAPFERQAVAKALGDAHVNARVGERTSGRYSGVLHRTAREARNEVAQRQNEREAADARMFALASDPDLQERGKLILRKQAVDEQLRGLKEKIGQAKSAAYAERRYLPAQEYRQMEVDLDALKTESLALQARLGELKKAEKERNRKIWEAEQGTFLKRFYEVVKAAVDPEELDEWVAEAQGEGAERSSSNP